MDASGTNPKHRHYQALILDMDGVLWRSDEPIGNLAAVFDTVRALRLKFALATNNSTRTVEQYVEKLAGFGVHLAPEQIITSASATAWYLQERFPTGGPVYIIGESGLRQSLLAKGFWEADENVVAVIAGLDRQLTYDKLKCATHLIRRGVPFIATNTDRALPTPDGLIPGAGAVTAALETASDVAPFVIGKPGSEMYRMAQQYLGVPPEDILVVGDRLETDIAGAQAMGCATALVLSGVSTLEMAQNWHPPVDYISADLTTLISGLKAQDGYQ